MGIEHSVAWWLYASTLLVIPLWMCVYIVFTCPGGWSRYLWICWKQTLLKSSWLAELHPGWWGRQERTAEPGRVRDSEVLSCSSCCPVVITRAFLVLACLLERLRLAAARGAVSEGCLFFGMCRGKRRAETSSTRSVCRGRALARGYCRSALLGCYFTEEWQRLYPGKTGNCKY